MRYFKLLFFIALYSLMEAVSAAQPSQEFIDGTTRVSAEQLINLANRLPDLVIIDARMRNDRVQGYIEDSLSLPNVETDCDSLAKVIPTKTRPVLFYCNGVKCGRSAVSAHIAVKCGYEHIYWFRGGFEEWKAKGYPFLKQPS